MNSLQRVMTVLEGGIPDTVPVCLHNSLLAAREAGIALEEYLTDARAAVRAHLHAWEKYGHDCILVDLDTTMLAEAMGARRDGTPGEPGHIASPAIESLSEVGKLKPVDPERDGRIPVMLEITSLLREAVGDEVAIRGNADQAAFSLAGLLRGTQDFLMDLATEPDISALAQLLEVCHQSHLNTHRALMKAGAHFTTLGDSPAGPDVISPAMFGKWARPYEERLVRELARDGSFVAIHICGDTSMILDALAAYPRCGFELDYKTDAATAKATVGRYHVLFGNVDPSGVLARGSIENVRARTRELIEQWKPGGNFILNAGCAIPASAPAENVRAFVETAREFGSYQAA